MKIFTVDDFFSYAEVVQGDGSILPRNHEWELEDVMFEKECMEDMLKTMSRLQVWSLIPGEEYDLIREGALTGDSVADYFLTKVRAQALCFDGVRMAGGVLIIWPLPKEEAEEAEETC